MKKLFWICWALTLLFLSSVSFAQSLELNPVTKTVFNGNFIYQLTDAGLVSVTYKNTHLFNLGIALYGETPAPNYIKSWDNEDWNWIVLTNNSTEITVEGTTNYSGFEYKQTWSFYLNKDLKITHTLTNNLGMSINNMEMYYVLDVDTNKNPNVFYELNELRHRVNFNSNIIINESFNETEGKLIFDLPGEPTLNFSDLFQDFQVNYLFVGNLNDASIELPLTKGIIIGVTKGNGTMLDGQTVVLDPSISEGIWTSIDTWTGANGTPWDTSIWEDLFTTGTTANTIQSNQGQLRVTDDGGDGRSNFVVKDAHKITLNSVGDVGYYEIEHKSTTDSGVNDTYTALGIANSSVKAVNGGFLSSVFIGEFLTNGTYNQSDTLVNSTEDPDGQPIAFKIEKISATDVNVNIWVNNVKTMDNNTFNIGTDVDFFFKVYAITVNADIGAYTNLIIDDLNIGVKSFDLNISVPQTDQTFDSDNDLNIIFSVLSINQATDLLFDINYGLTTDTNISIIDDGNVAFTDNLFCDSNSLNPSKPCYALWTTSGINGDFYLKILITDNLSSEIISETTGLFTLSPDQILRLNFRDENTDVIINPSILNISINDGDVNSWSANVVNGQLDINLSNYNSGKWKIDFGDQNHPTRTFIQDINNLIGTNLVFGMLQDSKGSNIDFVFYDQNGSRILIDANIEVIDSNNHITEKKTTGIDGSITFFLNPNDPGYQFNINDVNGSDYNYIATQITVKIPLDEEDLTLVTSVSNFTIRKRGIGSQDFNNLSIDTNVAIYANTVNYYQLIIGVVDENYFDRTYFLNLRGEISQQNLQPYLVTQAVNVGTQITITFKDRYTKETLTGAFLRVRKQLPNGSTEVVEFTQSDDSGRTQIAVLLGDEYFFDINFSNLSFTKTLQIIDSLGFTFSIDTGTGQDTNQQQRGFTVDYTPIGNNLILVDGNYNVTAEVNSSESIMVGIVLVITDQQNNLILYEDQNFPGGTTIAIFDVNLSQNIIDLNGLYAVQVIITDLNGVIYNNPFTRFFEPQRDVGGELFKNIGGVFEDFLGERLSLFILVLLCAFCTGAVTRFSDNQDIQIIFAASLMGFFSLIGGVDWGLWFFVTVPTVFLMLIRTRGFGRG